MDMVQEAENVVKLWLDDIACVGMCNQYNTKYYVISVARPTKRHTRNDGVYKLRIRIQWRKCQGRNIDFRF